MFFSPPDDRGVGEGGEDLATQFKTKQGKTEKTESEPKGGRGEGGGDLVSQPETKQEFKQSSTALRQG